MADAAEPTMRLADGTPVWVEGAGPVVVLVHGVMMDHRMWAAQAAALATDFRVVRYDMLGHGGAPDPAGRRSLGDFAAQAEAVVKAVSDGDVPPVLAGFSMGGLVAQAVAIRRNVALRGVVFMNAVYARSAAERQAVLSRLDLMHTGGAEGVIAAARERWFGADDRRDQAAKIEEMLGWIRDGDFAPKIKAYEVFATGDAETAGKLARVDIPALALTGELDAGSPPHMTERMAAELSRGRALVLDGQRHMMPVLDAGRVNAALRAFLAGL